MGLFSPKTTGLFLGLLVIAGSFLSVFGSSLGNLSAEEQAVHIDISSLPDGTPEEQVVQSDIIPLVSSPFTVGDDIQATRTVNVRSQPGTNTTILGAQIIAASGTLVEGPISADGYTWWNIDYTISPDGWTVENWLAPGGTVLPVTTQAPPKNDNASVPQDTPPPPPQNGYTLTDVSSHNSASSCWSAINGKVYDLTAWVNSHPGGKPAILMICGKDGSPLFNTQHGGASRPQSILSDYFIGLLI